VAVLQKLDVHRRNGHTYKETKHTTHEKAAPTTHEKNSISHKISQYSTSATNRIQDAKQRKTTAYTETTKHEHKEEATAGN
jgi:hypothetical protein